DRLEEAVVLGQLHARPVDKSLPTREVQLATDEPARLIAAHLHARALGALDGAPAVRFHVRRGASGQLEDGEGRALVDLARARQRILPGEGNDIPDAGFAVRVEVGAQLVDRIPVSVDAPAI